MSTHSDPDLARLAEAVVAAARPRLALLIGSRAQSSHRDDSDIDLLLVHAREDWLAPTRHAEAGRIRRALSNMGRPVDIVLLTPEEFDAWKAVRNHVAHNAAVAGKVLHERP